MPSTGDYDQRIARARRNSLLSESRRSVPATLLGESACPECGDDPCTCDQERDELKGRIPRESLEVAEILAAYDSHSFAFMVECEGMSVAAMRDTDPLKKETMAEDITAIAHTITENPDEPDDNLDQYQTELQVIGGDYGYSIF